MLALSLSLGYIATLAFTAFLIHQGILTFKPKPKAEPQPQDTQELVSRIDGLAGMCNDATYKGECLQTDIQTIQGQIRDLKPLLTRVQELQEQIETLNLAVGMVEIPETPVAPARNTRTRR